MAIVEWDFIDKFPKLKKGKTICVPFIDGLLYPEAFGAEMTPKELKAKLERDFISCGLVLRKVIPKKSQSYYKKSKILHRPYFAKLDDRGYDFTVKRIQEL